MTTLDWIINLSILVFMVATVIGRRRVTPLTFWRPLAIVAALGLWLLRPLPTAGHDTLLELAGVGLGAVFGVLAAAASTVRREGAGVVVGSGAAYAAVWVAAIGLRVAFAEFATHNPDFGRWLVHFSVQHAISGADAWRAAFVLMALTTVVVRVALIALRAQLLRAPQALTA